MVILLRQRQHRLEAVVSDNDSPPSFFFLFEAAVIFRGHTVLLDTFHPLFLSLSLADIFSPLIYSLSLFLSVSHFFSSGF